MVNLDKIRADMEKKYAADSEIKTVEVRADTLDECLADASVQLEASVSSLEYEVIEKGYGGIFGLMKKPWFVRVYENPESVAIKKKKIEDTLFDDIEMEDEIKEVNKDGIFYFHYFGTAVCVKIELPIGNGQPVNEVDLLNAANLTEHITIDENLLKQLCKTGTDGEYKEVGTYNHIPTADALLVVDITSDDMHGSITVTPPSNCGSDISYDQIVNALAKQGVGSGLDEGKIKQFVDVPIYNTPYEVATAMLPVDGRDAYISYMFETDTSKIRLQENSTGQVNFKELNLIQNVTEGQAVAQKVQAQKGKGGKTLHGRDLEAKYGKDIEVESFLGSNVKLDRDGSTIIAEKSGHVMLVAGKITVEQIYEVKGVNHKNGGSITYNGTVICRGDVDDGFFIKASGNVEIYGGVGKSKIEAEGDIVISQGVQGNNEAEIIGGKSIWARFIQNAKVSAEEYIVVNDSIMNSNVTAMKKIILKGKRASIIGGHLFATEEITAKDIGSPGSATETIVEVGFDPKAKQRLLELSEMQNALIRELEELEKNIATMENNKKVRRFLPKEKEEQLQALHDEHDKMKAQSDSITAEMDEINSRLRELKVVGKVNASGTVYEGTKVYVRDELDDVRQECKAVTFYYENGFVRRGKYDSSQVTEDVGAPDGYTSN